MKFQVIIADPPWSFSDKLAKMKSKTKRSAASQYKVLTLNDIMGMDVASLADPAGCVLGLWVPGSFMEAGMDVYRAWGFKLKQNFVWVKTKKKHNLIDPIILDRSLAFGMGRLFRQTHETALICSSGKSVYKSMEDHSQRSVCFYPNLKHSMKPQHLHDRFDVMFPNANKLELFARRDTPGWTCVGLECPSTLGEDIRDSISRLKAM
jgi:N6-adenosine-specific RNA methylase IME4